MKSQELIGQNDMSLTANVVNVSKENYVYYYFAAL